MNIKPTCSACLTSVILLSGLMIGACTHSRTLHLNEPDIERKVLYINESTKGMDVLLAQKNDSSIVIHNMLLTKDSVSFIHSDGSSSDTLILKNNKVDHI